MLTALTVILIEVWTWMNSETLNFVLTPSDRRIFVYFFFYPFIKFSWVIFLKKQNWDYSSLFLVWDKITCPPPSSVCVHVHIMWVCMCVCIVITTATTLKLFMAVFPLRQIRRRENERRSWVLTQNHSTSYCNRHTMLNCLLLSWV